MTSERRLGRLLANLSATTAVVLGSLYALGALYAAAQLRGAGLSITETLPLLALPGLLTRGMAVIGANAVPFLLSGLIIAAWTAPAWYYATVVGLEAESNLLRARLATLRGRVTGGVDELEDLRRGLDEASRAALLNPETTPNDVDRIRNLLRQHLEASERIDQTEKELSESEAALGGLPKIPKPLEFRHVTLGRRLFTILMVGVLIGNIVSAQPPIAIGLSVPFILLAVGPVRRAVRVFPHYFVAAVGFVFVCILIGAALFPPRLSEATIRLRTGTVASGGLIAHSDGAWYLATRRRHYVAIDDSLVAGPVRVAAMPRSRLKPVATYVWDAIDH